MTAPDMPAGTPPGPAREFLGRCPGCRGYGVINFAALVDHEARIPLETLYRDGIPCFGCAAGEQFRVFHEEWERQNQIDQRKKYRKRA